MNLLDHGAADTLGSIGAIMWAPLLRMPLGNGAGPGIRKLLMNRNGIHFAALVKASKIF